MIGIILIGFALRLVSLNQSLWLDEATTALVAKMSVGDIFTKFVAGDVHPPFYYLLMHYWVTIFGSSEMSLRAPSVIAGLGAIFVVYKLAGKVPALLLATSGLHIYYSQEARMYALVTLFVALAVLSFVKINERGRLGDYLLFSVSLFLIAATDYVALLILPVFWILGRRFWKKLFMSHIILIAFGVIWLPYFLKQLKAGLLVKSAFPVWWQVMGQTSLKNIFLIPIKFMIGRISFENNVVYAIIVGAVGLVFAYLFFMARKASRLYWLWLMVPVVLGALVGFWVPTLSYHRFLFVLPAFYVLIAFGIGKSRLFLWIVLAVNVLGILYYMLTPNFHREDWRSAALAIGEEKIVFPAKSQKEALIYYGKENQIIDVAQIDKKDREIWLSRYVWEIFDPQDSARKSVESLGYNKTSEYNFNGVVFWKYENRN